MRCLETTNARTDTAGADPVDGSLEAPRLKRGLGRDAGAIIDLDSKAINGICLESPTDSSTGETITHDG